MTPTEDNYADRTTSTEATVRILGESCTAVDGSNAPNDPNQGLQIVANLSFLSSIAGVS